MEKCFTLVISSFALDELWRVTTRKFPSRKSVVEQFLRNLTFELAYTPSVINREEYPQAVKIFAVFVFFFILSIEARVEKMFLCAIFSV
jgi:hypothetical protein